MFSTFLKKVKQNKDISEILPRPELGANEKKYERYKFNEPKTIYIAAKLRNNENTVHPRYSATLLSLASHINFNFSAMTVFHNTLMF